MKKLIITLLSLVLFSTSIIAQTDYFESNIKKIENLINTKSDELKNDTTKATLKKEIDSLKSEKNSLYLAKVEYQDLISGKYKSRLEALEKQLNLKDETSKTKTSFFTLDRILSIFALLTAIGLSITFLLDKKNRRDDVLYILTQKKKQETHLPRIELFKNEIIEKAVEKCQSKGNNNANTLPIYDNIIQDLKERLSKLEQEKIDVSKQLQSKNTVDLPSPNKSMVLYADAIINERFNKVTEQPNDDTVFELILNTSNPNNATFDVYKEAYRRVLKNPDFVDGCDKQKLSVSPVDLSIEKGVSDKSDNGKWQISKKMVIKFV